jgi:hypothetical protein
LYIIPQNQYSVKPKKLEINMSGRIVMEEGAGRKEEVSEE